MLSAKQLDLKRTVESTLDWANGWLKADYPSTQSKNKLRIDVEYPDNDLSQKPIAIRLSRGNNLVRLKKETSKSSKNKDIVSYSLNIHTASGKNYNITETSLTGRTESENEVLLEALQKDELGQYIFWISKKAPVVLNICGWDLNKMMQKTRE